MTGKFDPYHKWLAIPPAEQPPNHYRLLGVELFEDDPDVIESAADRQMTHVRGFQSGPRAEQSQRILNEIAAAKTVLLDSRKKADYDAELKARPSKVKRQTEPTMRRAAPPAAASPGGKPAGNAASPPPQAPSPTAMHRQAPEPQSPAVPLVHTHTSVRRRASRQALPLILIVASVLGLMAFAMLFAAWELMQPVAVVDEADPGDDGTFGSPPPLPVAEEPPRSEPPRPMPDDPPSRSPPPDISPDLPDAPPPEEVAPEPPPKEIAPDETPNEAIDDPSGAGERIDEPPPPARQPVPDADARAAKREEIASLFNLPEARTPEAKTAVASEMLEVGRQTNSDANAQFTLLDTARQLAAEAGEIRLACEAIDALEANFEFDALAARLTSLREAFVARRPPSEKHDAVAVGIETVHGLVVADRYDDAEELLEALLGISRRTGDKQLITAVVQHRHALSDLMRQFKKARPAVEAVADGPADPQANLVAGRFFAFYKGDWQRALPLFSECSDEDLALAAQGELAKPQQAPEQAGLADTWWRLAQREDDEHCKGQMQARALAWYSRAESGLIGLQAAEAQQRIQQLTAAGVEPSDLNVGRLTLLGQAYEIAPDDVVEGLVARWKLDERQGTVARDSAGGHHGAIDGPQWVAGVQGTALRFDGIDDVVAMGNPDALNFAGQITLSAWIRPVGLPNRKDFASGFMNITAHGFNREAKRSIALRIAGRDSAIQYEVGSWMGEGDDSFAVFAVPTEDVGRWTHLCGTYDGRFWSLYRNGERVAATETAQGAVLVPAAWGIGAHPTQKIRVFRGDIDDVRIYRRALRADEVQRIYQTAVDAHTRGR